MLACAVVARATLGGAEMLSCGDSRLNVYGRNVPGRQWGTTVNNTGAVLKLGIVIAPCVRPPSSAPLRSLRRGCWNDRKRMVARGALPIQNCLPATGSILQNVHPVSNSLQHRMMPALSSVSVLALTPSLMEMRVERILNSDLDHATKRFNRESPRSPLPVISAWHPLAPCLHCAQPRSA